MERRTLKLLKPTMELDYCPTYGQTVVVRLRGRGMVRRQERYYNKSTLNRPVNAYLRGDVSALDRGISVRHDPLR